MIYDNRIAVIIPAYNEERMIGSVLRSIPSYVDQIIVVDDGSNDCTLLCVKEEQDERIQVIQHTTNRGVGSAISTGYKAAFKSGAYAAAVMAGDGQMDPDDLEKLIHPVIDNQAEYTKGDRLSYPQAIRRMPIIRWLGNHFLSLLTRWVTGLSIQDSQCGYTVLSRRAAITLPFDFLWHGYGYPNDILGWLAKANHRVQDVVVRPVYRDEKSGIGFRHAFIIIPYVLFRILCRRITKFQQFSRESDQELSGSV